MRLGEVLGVGVLVLGSCGRVAFDPHSDSSSSSDSPVGSHDEDGDGTPDLTDRCPHIADQDQVDADGDLVGDPCDPEPSIARQALSFFTPMTIDSQPFTTEQTSGAWIQLADGVRYDGTALGALSRSIRVDDADAWIGADIVAVKAFPHQLSLAFQLGSGQRFFYGDLYETTPSDGFVGISEFDGVTYLPRQTQPLATAIHTGAIVFHVIMRTNTSVAIEVSWPGEPYTTSLVTPTYAGGNSLYITVQGLEIQIRYVAIVDTN